MDPSETHDIFVSYAHADNGLALGASSSVGWVTALAANLNEGPSALLKNIFIDHQLRSGDEFNDELLDKVRRSRLLVLLLSQNYVDSQWCGKELEHFVRSHGGSAEKPRDVLVVEIWPFEDLTGVPPIIQALRKGTIHAKFWYKPVNAASPLLAGYPSPKDCDEEGTRYYWRILNELRVPIDARIRAARTVTVMKSATTTPDIAAGDTRPESATTNGKAGVSVAPLGTVVLADATDDLELQHGAIRAALAAEGITVLPEGDYVGLTPQEFDATISADLERSDLFVQLLSATAGRKFRGFAAPLPQLQFQRARDARRANMPIMQWCESLPAADEIADPGHAALFQTESLRVTNRAAFQREVIERLHAERTRRERAAATPTPPALARVRKPLVFVDDLASVPALTGRLSAIIRGQNFDQRGLPPNAPLGNDGVDVTELLRPCRAGITIFADPSKRFAVYNRLLYFLNQLAESGLPLERWGVYLENGTVASEFRIESDDVVAVNEQGLADFLRGLSPS
jgi:hypothetical protein